MTHSLYMTVGYVRLSLDKYGDHLGVARQREDIAALAHALGWGEITETYEDNDVSANTDKKRPRPAFERLLSDIRAGRVTHVLCYDQDRLVRDMRQLEDVVDAVEAGDVSLTSVNGDIDLRTDNGRMVARIKAAVARNEIEKLGRRVSRQAQQRAQNGRRSGNGLRTFGFTHDFDIIESEAEALREVFRQKAAGSKTSAIVAWLNHARVPTTTGHVGRWTPNQVSTFIRRHEYVGDVTYKGQVVNTDAHEAIINRALFESANAQMPRPTTWRENPESGLLTGLLVCEPHRALMILGRGRESTTWRNYHCRYNRATESGCHLAAAPADEAVLKALERSVGELRASSASNTPAATSPAHALEQEMKRAERAFTQGHLARAETDAILRYLGKRKADEQRSAEEETRYTDRDDRNLEAPHNWDTLSLDEKRDRLARTIHRIAVARPLHDGTESKIGAERMTIYFHGGRTIALRGPTTRMEVAQQAGCTSDAVSRVINGRWAGYVSVEVKERVERVVYDTKFVPQLGRVAAWRHDQPDGTLLCSLSHPDPTTPPAAWVG